MMFVMKRGEGFVTRKGKEICTLKTTTMCMAIHSRDDRFLAFSFRETSESGGWVECR